MKQTLLLMCIVALATVVLSVHLDEDPVTKLISLSASKSNIVCPGGQTTCDSDQTCCLLVSGDYGCCPMPNAVCCQDKKHCCPNGYTCNEIIGACVIGEWEGADIHSVPFSQKKPATKVARANLKQDCPDGKSQCADDATCCVLASGEYGCCPLVKAVCCDDHVHCCPSGYTCDVKDGRCNKATGEFVPFALKMPAEPKPVVAEVDKVNSVCCPDGVSFCPNDNTCCLMADGRTYGCCPIPEAVCCSDNIHCCPAGMVCNLQHQCCDNSNAVGFLTRIKWTKKVPAAKHDGHCNGDKGKAAEDKLNDEVAPLLLSAPKTKKPAHVRLSRSVRRPLNLMTMNVVECEDGIHVCSDSSTCCPSRLGNVGCCAQPNAVCCGDGVNCCPPGYECSRDSDVKCAKIHG